MPDKNTEELLHEIMESSSIEPYMQENTSRFSTVLFSEHIRQLLSMQQLSRAEVIERACLEPVYGYQIFQGRKRPSRDKVIQLCFGFRLGIEASQRLLEMAGVNRLYARNRRDSVILFALNKGIDIHGMDTLLYELGEQTLL